MEETEQGVAVTEEGVLLLGWFFNLDDKLASSIKLLCFLDDFYPGTGIGRVAETARSPSSTLDPDVVTGANEFCTGLGYKGNPLLAGLTL